MTPWRMHFAAGRCCFLLDNCDHLVQGCAELADRLLRGCPTLQILATCHEELAAPCRDDPSNLAAVILNQGRVLEVRALYAEALELISRVGDRAGLADALRGLWRLWLSHRVG